MTFEAYLDNIQAKTGKSPDDFFELAKKKGMIEHGKIIAKHAELPVLTEIRYWVRARSRQRGVL